MEKKLQLKLDEKKIIALNRDWLARREPNRYPTAGFFSPWVATLLIISGKSSLNRLGVYLHSTRANKERSIENQSKTKRRSNYLSCKFKCKLLTFSFFLSRFVRRHRHLVGHAASVRLRWQAARAHGRFEKKLADKREGRSDPKATHPVDRRRSRSRSRRVDAAAAAESIDCGQPSAANKHHPFLSVCSLAVLIEFLPNKRRRRIWPPSCCVVRVQFAF